MRKFEVVSKYKDKNINLPKRSTTYSAGYDIEAAEDTIIPSLWQQMIHLIYTKNLPSTEAVFTISEVKDLMKKYSMKATLVPTGLKVHVEKDEYLEIKNRSGNGTSTLLVIPHSSGIIDADYVDNENNEGHIMVGLINLSPFNIEIKKGEKIAQGIISRYRTVDNEDKSSLVKRAGGFGSTGI